MQRKKNAQTFRKEISKNWILNLEFQKLATASGTGWISNFERKPRTVRISLAQDRVVCYHVAKLHTTVWQSPIKVAGADHAV